LIVGTTIWKKGGSVTNAAQYILLRAERVGGERSQFVVVKEIDKQNEKIELRLTPERADVSRHALYSPYSREIRASVRVSVCAQESSDTRNILGARPG